MANSTTAHGRYEELRTIRDPYLQRARDCALVTLPYLFPPEGSSGETTLPTPFQSVGARGVNNLAAKLLLALFPPNSPFFEFTVDDFAVSELAGESQQEDMRGEIDTALASIVRAIVQQVEKPGTRNKVFEALKNLIVGGNILLEVLEDDSLRAHQLGNYVVLRDGEGEPLDIILKETLSRRALPANLREFVDPAPPEDDPEDESTEETVPLYTWVRRNEGRWDVHQEIGEEGTLVPDSDGTYPLDRNPWIPLGMIEVEGEHYSRSYVEEYLGDLFSLERSSQAVIEFGAAASRIINFVDPGGTTDPDEFADAASGDTLEGNAKDVSTYALEKFHDFRVTGESARRIEERLEQAFLLMTGIQRQAERVTAEEIRRLADELEQALGGVYSLLSDELQAPLVRVLMHQNKKLPKLPMKLVNLRVVTGLAALGRNHDLVKLDTFVAGAGEMVGPEALADYLNIGAYLKRRAEALNFPVEGMIRDEAEVQKLRQQRQDQELLKQASPKMVDAASRQAEAAASQNSGE